MPKASLKTIAQNKKAFHDYFVAWRPALSCAAPK